MRYLFLCEALVLYLKDLDNQTCLEGLYPVSLSHFDIKFSWGCVSYYDYYDNLFYAAL